MGFRLQAPGLADTLRTLHPESPKPKAESPHFLVLVLTTGGTIAMRHSDAAGGAVPSVGGEELAGILNAAGTSHRFEEFANLPSSHLTFEHMWALRKRIVERSLDGAVGGIVVTHGTDTLEETAMLLDLTVPGEKPIVVTGSMRAYGDLGFDGGANLASAIAVAANPKARGLGCLVVMNEEIHAARSVMKTDTLALDTFQSPYAGPLGRLYRGRVLIERRVDRHTLYAEKIETRVPLIKLAVGQDGDIIDYAVSRGVRGMVIECFGGGRVPPWILPSVEKARAADIAVVIASRCPSGRIDDTYGYEGAFGTLKAMGCLFAGGLNGQKARIQLAVLLGHTAAEPELRSIWRSLSNEPDLAGE